MNIMRKISIVFLAMSLAVSAAACSNKDDDKGYEKPVKAFIDGIQENEPEQVIEAFGGDLVYEAYEDYYDENEDNFGEEYDDGEEMAEDYMDFITDSYHDFVGDEFTYEITDAEKLDEDEIEDVEDELYLIEVKLDAVYCLEIEYEADDRDVEEVLNDEWEEFFVGKSDGQWILLNYEDMFDLY